MYIVAPLYARAGRRPELYSADVSPWWMAEPSCTRWLWPRPMRVPSWAMRAAPIWGVVSALAFGSGFVRLRSGPVQRVRGTKVGEGEGMHAGSCGRGATDRYTALRVGELGLFKGYREAFGVVHLAGGLGWAGWKWSLGGGEVCDMLARPPGSPSTPPGPIIFAPIRRHITKTCLS